MHPVFYLYIRSQCCSVHVVHQERIRGAPPLMRSWVHVLCYKSNQPLPLLLRDNLYSILQALLKQQPYMYMLCMYVHV